MSAVYVYKPFKYFFSVIFLTWVIESGMVWMSYNDSAGQGDQEIFSLLVAAELFIPCVVAFVMIFLSGSDELKRDFLSRLFGLRRIKLYYLPIVLFTMPVLAAVSIYLSTYMGGKRRAVQYQ